MTYALDIALKVYSRNLVTIRVALKGDSKHARVTLLVLVNDRSRSGGVNKVCTREAESMQNVVATKDLLIFALLVPLFFTNAHIKKGHWS